jgi:uncharacterized damage-inducible protein DinB
MTKSAASRKGFAAKLTVARGSAHARLIDRLEANGAELLWYVSLLSNEEIHAPPKPRAWSIHQTLCHLRDVEQQVFLYRAERILKEDAPRVPDFDQDKWMRQHYSPREPIKNILNDFKTARRKFVTRLRRATDRDWARSAIHPEYGNISLEWLVTHCYNHTLEHTAQLGYAYEKRLLKR